MEKQLSEVRAFQSDPHAVSEARKARAVASRQTAAMREDMRRLYERHGTDPGWLLVLIAEAAVVAEETGQRELARVLGAIGTAAHNEDLAMLSDPSRPNGNGTMLGVANAYVPDSSVGRTNQEMARDLAFSFVSDEPSFPAPPAFPERALGGSMPFARFCTLLAADWHPAMRNAFGAPQENWQEEVIRKVKEVRERDFGSASRQNRGAIHYARAVVRGWTGLPADKVKTLTSELASVEAFL